MTRLYSLTNMSTPAGHVGYITFQLHTDLADVLSALLRPPPLGCPLCDLSGGCWTVFCVSCPLCEQEVCAVARRLRPRYTSLVHTVGGRGEAAHCRAPHGCGVSGLTGGSPRKSRRRRSCPERGSCADSADAPAPAGWSEPVSRVAGAGHLAGPRAYLPGGHPAFLFDFSPRHLVRGRPGTFRTCRASPENFTRRRRLLRCRLLKRLRLCGCRLFRCRLSAGVAGQTCRLFAPVVAARLAPRPDAGGGVLTSVTGGTTPVSSCPPLSSPPVSGERAAS